MIIKNTIINSNKFHVVTIIVLSLIYFIIFSNYLKFSNYVEFGGDQMFYQSMAVNFVKGHGYPKVGGFEKFEEYKFSLSDYSPSIALYEKSAGPYSFSKHPAYPLLIGLVYLFFGINPIIIKYIQLILIIIVSAFIPWLGYKFWNKKGYISGLIASPLFLIYNYNFVGNIFTEPLIVFTIFLIISGYIYYKHKQNILSSIILGIILGFSLLLKGTLIFIPPLILIHLIIKFRKSRRKRTVIHAGLIVFFTIISVLPWTIYANIKNKENVISAKKGLSILLDKNLSEEYKSAFIDTSSLIYSTIKPYPIFLAKAKNVNDVLISNSILDSEQHFYIDNSSIHDKIILQKFYIQSNKFFIFSSQSPMVMIDGNCELYPKERGLNGTDGGSNVGWIRNTNCFYYNDKMEDSPVILRVLNFYLHYPVYLFKLVAKKIMIGFFRLYFLWVIIFLFFLESLGSLINKYNKNLKFSCFYNILSLILTSCVIYIIVFFIPPVPTKDSYFFYLIILLILLFSIFVNIHRKFINANTVLISPDIINIIFINFFMVNVIVFGFERQNSVINFILTLTAIYYLICYIEKLIKNIKSQKQLSNSHK